jgi:hypothetical protein
MRIRYFLLCLSALLLIPIQLAKSQETKVTLQQCRVDAEPFIKNMLANPADLTAEFQAYRDYLKRFPLSEITRRYLEMYDCTTVDAQNSQAYKTVALILESESTNRYLSFLIRHNLMDQFRAEDANGVR